MKTPIIRSIAALALILTACSEDGPTTPGSALQASKGVVNGNEPAAPSGLVTIALGDKSLTLWPFSGVDFAGATGGTSDPINLVFTGKADPREIRAALLGLSGTRSGALSTFNCTWSDAVGDPQAGYGVPAGWVGSSIQLQCGDFYGPRFHIRLFRQGDVTVANAHYEILIPGTNMHEVLSWQLAEQFVMADVARTGFLGSAPSATQVINPAPYFRAVQAAVAASLTPQQIAGLGLLVNGDGTASIPNDGRATILQLASAPSLIEGVVDQDFIVTFGQVIPKPFCVAGTTGYLYAAGPIHVRMRSGITDGNYSSEWTADGTLTLIPFSLSTGQFAGSPYQGEISERVLSDVTRGTASAEHFSDRRETPDNGTTRGIRIEHLRVREDGKDISTVDISC